MGEVTAIRSGNSWVDRVERALTYWGPARRRMREAEEIAYYGDLKDWAEGGMYVAGLVVRHIGRMAAHLYARDPQVEITLDPRRMDFEVWDGSAEAFVAALEGAQSGDVEAALLVEDVRQGRAEREVVHRFAKTLEALVQRSWGRRFRLGMRGVVRRGLVHGVGWVKVEWIGEEELTPDILDAVDDRRVAMVMALEMARREDEEDGVEGGGGVVPLPPLRVSGLLYRFPKARDIVLDPEIGDFATLDGCTWIAERHVIRRARLGAIFGVDPSEIAADYEARGMDAPERVEVWEIWDRRLRRVIWVTRGKAEPLAEVPAVDAPVGFFPYVPFVVHATDVPGEGLYPPSDVQLLREIVKDYNARRQAVRDYVAARRPRWVIPDGSVDPRDIERLVQAGAFKVVPMRSLQPGQKVGDLLQPLPVHEIDPLTVDTTSLFADFQLVSGSNEIVLGRMGDATATAVVTAEQARTTELGAHGAALDETLGEVARKAASLLVQHADGDHVRRVVGRGAFWPEEVERRWEMFLALMVDVRAGSSGRPNEQAEAAKIERVLPLLLQIPGLNPTPLLKRLLEVLNLRGVDLDAAVADGMMSVVAQNAAAARSATRNETGQNVANADVEAASPRVGAEIAPTGGALPMDRMPEG